MQKVFIVSAKRSAIGSFGGAFKDVTAVELGKQVLMKMLSDLSLDAGEVDEVILGNVIGSACGMNIARQISLGAGIPVEKPAFIVNKVCGSGMKAISLAASSIRAGEAEVVVAGGVENMSRIPYSLTDFRWGGKMGNKNIVDLMINDGLTDVFNNYHMGVTAENLAEKFKISREDMDLFAASSQNKTEEAVKSGKFKDEIVPIVVPQRKGDPVIIEMDEFPRNGVTVDSLAKLRPAFKKEGTVTAANSSGINDGAALLILMSEKKVKESGFKPLAEYVNSATAGVDPSIMGYGPVPAIRKVLDKSKWKLQEIELAELNEAFAAQSIAVLRGLEQDGIGRLDPEIVNVNGGAIALGHPIGASGTRIVVTLLHEMIKQNKNKGLASLCIGGGMGIATLWQR